MDGTEFHDVTITVEDDKETCEEGILEEIQIGRPVNMKISGLLWQMWMNVLNFEDLNKKP